MAVIIGYVEVSLARTVRQIGLVEVAVVALGTDVVALVIIGLVGITSSSTRLVYIVVGILALI